jgi:hypothetical protein
MATPEDPFSARPPSNAWNSLVTRSIEAWDVLVTDVKTERPLWVQLLQHHSCLDDFLREAPKSMMFCFFQKRDAFLSQKTMAKWSHSNLDNYILLPPSLGFVSRKECFFVSHFWRTQAHPDPHGVCLRLHQAGLRHQHWSYIWVDWTCIPQSPRSPAEEAYFLRSLQTMSGLIRNCGFVWFYPPWEARLWILYEIAEFILTSTDTVITTHDIKKYQDHIQEMLQTSVRSVLDKYNYRCTFDRDKMFLTSWLELLVLLRKLPIELLFVRRLLGHMTWAPMVKDTTVCTDDGSLQLRKFEGILVRNGECYLFTPFPEWLG